MNKEKVIDLFDQDQRIDVEYPGIRREITANVVRHVDNSGNGEGMVIYSHLDETNVEDAIREQIAYFESLGQDFEWKVYDYDQPPDLKDRLERHGFSVENAEALMILDLEEAPEILWKTIVHDVRRVKDPEKIADILSIKQQVWNEDFSSLGDFLREALTNFPDQMSIYMAYIDEKPVSTAWIYFSKHSQFGSLWGGASLRGYRRRGLYTALLAVRAQEAKARRVRYLTVDASNMSCPILEKFGFERIAWTNPCKWKCK
jgi:GNAT superfamily N-acetyltransferase